jgi:hypothetical protein
MTAKRPMNGPPRRYPMKDVISFLLFVFMSSFAVGESEPVHRELKPGQYALVNTAGLKPAGTGITQAEVVVRDGEKYISVDYSGITMERYLVLESGEAGDEGDFMFCVPPELTRKAFHRLCYLLFGGSFEEDGTLMLREVAFGPEGAYSQETYRMYRLVDKGELE